MNILEGLSWEVSSETISVADNLSSKHLLFIVNNIKANLDGYPDTIESILGLDNPTLYRLISSPQVCSEIYRYHSNPHALAASLKNYLLLEKKLKGEKIDCSLQGWSCMADYYVRDSSIYTSPKVLGITIDFEAAFEKNRPINSNFRPTFGLPSKYSYDQMSKITNKIEKSLSSIKSANPSVFYFVNKLIKSIIPRFDKKNLTFKGSSNREFIGRMNSFNCHLEGVDYSVLANSIIHESIHIALYILEQERECIDSSEVAHDTRIKSPWSGNRVNALAIIHATFVWYALYMFWINNDHAKFFNPKIVDFYLDFCGKGFKENRAIDSLAPYSKNIRPDFYSQLEAIQYRMSKLV